MLLALRAGRWSLDQYRHHAFHQEIIIYICRNFHQEKIFTTFHHIFQHKGSWLGWNFYPAKIFTYMVDHCKNKLLPKTSRQMISNPHPLNLQCVKKGENIYRRTQGKGSSCQGHRQVCVQNLMHPVYSGPGQQLAIPIIDSMCCYRTLLLSSDHCKVKELQQQHMHAYRFYAIDYWFETLASWRLKV